MTPTPEHRTALVAAEKHLKAAIAAFKPVLRCVEGRHVIADDPEERLLRMFHEIQMVRHEVWRVCPEAR